MRILTGCFVVVSLAAQASAQHWFDTGRIYPESDLGRIWIAEDLDGDQDVDLVWVDVDSLQVWFNDGSGEFDRGPLHATATPLVLPESTSYALQVYPRAGDVNGDGLKDIVVGVNIGLGDAVFVTFLLQPSGSFVEVLTDIPATPGTFLPSIQGLALGDIDLDGDLEVGTAHDSSMGFTIGTLSSTVNWWNFQGGAFTASPGLVLTGQVSRPTHLAALDATGDGRDDLVVVANNDQVTASAVRILPTVSGQPTLGTLVGVDSVANEIAVGDLEGDGDLDFVVAGRKFCPDLQINAFVNQGFGVFAKVTSLLQPLNETFCAYWPHPVLGDLDADGDLDLFQSGARYHFMRNDGAHHFAAISNIVSDNETGFQGEATGTGDIDGDGHLDLIAARVIHFGEGVAPVDPVSPLGGTANVAAFRAEDFEDDGDLDLLLGATVGTNDATGSFTPVTVWPPLPGGFLFLATTAFGDFNGDGRQDQLVTKFEGLLFNLQFLGMNLLLDNGLGSYSDAGIVLPAAAGSITADAEGQLRRGVDVDQDGDVDVPVGGGYHANLGGGMLQPLVPLFAATESADWADVDQDGDLDALTLLDTAGTATYSLQRRQSGLTFTAEVLAVRPSGSLGLRARFLDLDGDGDLDVALPVKSGAEAALLFENQNGVLSVAPALAGGGGSTVFVSVADVDGDGLADVVCDRNSTVTFGATNLQIHRRTGPGLVYEPHRDFVSKGLAAFVDVDEDGDGDGVGQWLIRNRRFGGAADGVIRQYGAGSKGSGGAVPVLGASGPIRAGSTVASLRVRRALGGAPGVFFIGTGEASLSGVIPGAKFLVQPPPVVVPFPLAGTPGVAGGGTLTLDLTGFLPVVAGLTVYHQLVVVDPGAALGGVAASNGLSLTYGL